MNNAVLEVTDLKHSERKAAELGLLNDFPDLMRPEHMAAALGWHVVYVRRLCHDGVIPGAFKVGSRWYCSKVDFYEWVMNHD